MKIHHLRSATFIIESGEKFILIDPMLGKKGSLPPFSVIKAKATKNPTVEMPSNADELLNKVTHTLITHSQTFGIKALQHGDHLDPAGEAFLTDRNIPVATPAKDKAYLEKYGLTVKWGIEDWQTIDFLGGKLTAVPALHGHGWIHKVMANGVGFFLELPNEPSIYISGDTVLTDDVRRALNELKPDITVVAAGRARMDVGQPLLMSIDEVLEFVRLSPNKVIANHMEALNHCAVTRPILKEAIGKNGLSDKVLIPADGETLEF
ncbi:TPA: MBL fold metallo-hydrolase [Vibrio parahaemolyticus]|uniref:MBL fold metallo-hydrolase n=1 Tax=Vibrio parahaemolyticus TaxID=670 RepID=A0A7Z2RRS4_VIBPH|nr:MULTISPECIES: MBL fold metallo-hydrolase [Vibrio harveyi group]ANZ12628.1 beta-lactamase-like protein [Vibrio parahaemolyticus]EGQ8103412.1 MBL fold metallo-hydrolase [Vibrio parahaemolyticus]EGR1577988.1 MBL fold metallo-hydrolase [Vibrio parahaemolyticus]EHE7896269.1 MBL fold metallo-hydrolase [Vibrio parahaemolyticus]EIO5095566.1 MBL fold metallo-hydrolase [Vibrio parahaemolyticus]